ncbi:outer membrane beta-barrel family protein [Hymenobacter sp. DG25A]|uniref:outer membrane beta-barrel family protein n=1 Tax=Hymenobacter sp. DG25A TaxID=1385663 RepID=UPI0006BDC356|nr:outer membrane beta-barrel family protein [Hymenobacter sp. DG25A]ALD21116.1 hypothetical protein AM218_07690 [Hymenobacter sp. DG25A]
MFFPLGLRAQNTGSVSGKLMDQATKQALPFVNVVLLRAQDSTLVTGAQTTEDGAFLLEKVALGRYMLRATVIGYQPIKRTIVLAAEAPSLQLGTLALNPIVTQLKGVTVTGQKETVQNELGKRVINVEKDLSSVGGTAVNVLQNVPSVAVDANGTISLRGSSNLTILIDGKPSGTSNGGSGSKLDQIPASRISQVEIITNPSAKYDASGAGVINIITKKERKNGINGQVGLVVGNGEKYAPTFSLNRRQGAANWNFSYNGRDQRFSDKSRGTQTALLPTGETIRTSQEGSGVERRMNHSLNLGVEYDLNEEQNLSFSLSPSMEGERNLNKQTLTTAINNEQQPNQLGQQAVDVDVLVWNADASYRRTWKEQKGRELSSNAGWVKITADVPFTQRLSDAPSQRQEFAVNATIAYGTLDYVRPLADGKSRLETGLKVQTTWNDGSADQLTAPTDRPNDFVLNPARAIQYDFREVLPAGYVTYQRPLGKNYNVQGGLRAEYTNLSGAVQGGQGQVKLDYLSFFPSATLSRELGKEPGQNRLQLSYARRINRPNFMQQLPFQLFQDARNYRLGNPSLRAEFSHNVELGQQLNLSNGTALTGTLFGRFTDDVIQRIRTIDTTATRLNQAGIVTAETYRNVGRTTNLGAEMTWNQPLAKWWRVGLTGSLYRSQIASNASVDKQRSALAGTLRLNNSFTPRPSLDVQLTGSWRSATLTAQGRQLAYGGLDVAVRQRLFQDRAALTLRVSDLFDTQVSRSEIDTETLQTTARYKNETRVGWLGFTWYIGATKPPKKIEQLQNGGGGFGG